MSKERSRRPGRAGTPWAAHAAQVRGQQDRVRIAQASARLIAEHGITDWTAAKRKAARQLGVPEGPSLPSNEEIEQALTDYHALFDAEAHAASLRAQRVEALRWMRRLAQWDPVLVGGVAAGWATAHSDVRLELVADDAKSVEIALAADGVRYDALPARSEDPPEVRAAELRIDGRQTRVRLSIISVAQRRNRARRDPEPRLDVATLSDLLETGDESHAAAPRS